MKSFPRIRFLSAILAGAVFASGVAARPAQEPDRDTVIAAHVKAFLADLVGAADAESLRRFMNEHMDRSAHQRNDAGLLAYLQQTRAELAGGEFDAPVRSGELTRTLYARDAAAGDAEIELRFAVLPPHAIEQIAVTIELAPSGPPVPRGLDGDAMADRLRQEIDRLAASDRFSGTVLLAHDGEVLLREARGMASQRFGVPMQVDTRLNLASMGKMFTGVLIAQLLAAGDLRLDATVGEYLPEYRNREVATSVTIEQLLTHTSGLGSFWNERFAATWAQLRSVEDTIALFDDESPAFPPGTRFRYSNAGYVILGRIAEVVTGLNYFDLVRQRVYQPAGMARTDAYELDRPTPLLAIGYTHRNPDREREAGPWRNNLFQGRVKGGPAGGSYSTVDDLLAFVRALEDDALLPAEWRLRALTGHVRRVGFRYGYGFVVGEQDGHDSYGHTGGAQGVSTALRHFPGLGFTYVVLSNYDDGAEDLADLLDRMILAR